MVVDAVLNSIQCVLSNEYVSLTSGLKNTVKILSAVCVQADFNCKYFVNNLFMGSCSIVTGMQLISVIGQVYELNDKIKMLSQYFHK